MENNQQSGRRNFLKDAALMGAASLAGAAGTRPASAEPSVQGKPLKIGCLGVNGGTFINWSWSDIIEGLSPANNARSGNLGTTLLNMDITHVWDINPEGQVKDFAQRMNAEIVPTYDAMVGKVDGMIFSGYNEFPWFNKLTRPYIDAGIPCYISRPFAASLRDVDEILELAAKRSTPILMTSKHEHYVEVPALKAKLPNVGNIDCVQATCNSNDFPMHMHTFFALPKIFGYNVEEVGLNIDSLTRASNFQIGLRFGGWEDQRPFLCSMMKMSSNDSFSITVHGRNGMESVRFERPTEWRDALLFRYMPQVLAMQRCFEGEMFEPLENIRVKTEMFLTALNSHLEKGGAMVKMGSLSPDWRAPQPQENWIPDSIFS